jgi:hypothetical protein
MKILNLNSLSIIWASRWFQMKNLKYKIVDLNEPTIFI